MEGQVISYNKLDIRLAAGGEKGLIALHIITSSVCLTYFSNLNLLNSNIKMCPNW